MKLYYPTTRREGLHILQWRFLTGPGTHIVRRDAGGSVALFRKRKAALKAVNSMLEESNTVQAFLIVITLKKKTARKLFKTKDVGSGKRWLSKNKEAGGWLLSPDGQTYTAITADGRYSLELVLRPKEEAEPALRVTERAPLV